MSPAAPPDRSLAFAVAVSIAVILLAIGGGIGAARLSRPAPTPSPSPRPAVAPSAAPTIDTAPLVFTQALSAGCAAGSSVYVVSDGGGIGRFVDDRWQLVDATARSLVAMTCAGDRAIAVGGGGRVVTIDDREETIRSDAIQLDDLLGVAPLEDGVLAVGRAGSVQRMGGGSWGLYANGIDEDLYATAAFGPLSAWAVGAGGVSYRLEPAGWRPVATGTTATLRSLSATSVEDVVAVGDDGVVLVWGGRWKQLTEVPAVTYRAVLRAGPITYAAGDAGTLISFQSAPFTRADVTRIDLGTSCTLRGLFARDGDVWVVGSDAGRAAVWRLRANGTFRWGDCP